MDLETLKDISTVASPLTKTIVETYLAPKLSELKNIWKRKQKIIDYSFEDKFTDYLCESYEKYAILNTLAFKTKKVLLSDVYVPLQLVCVDSKKTICVDSFKEEFFRHTNKILITDSAGMGKSTISKKLLLCCIEENKGIPVLIELRRLSKSKGIVDEIIEQLNPINETIDKQFILDLIKRGDFLFFLDGFDEISFDDRVHVTNEIQNFVSKARSNKFILTSRPEDSLTSFGEFIKYKIQPLKANEAYTLLSRYDNEGEVSKLLVSKIQEKKIHDNIKDYLTTPLLVSLLFTAFEHKQRIPFKKHIFYRQVYDALYESHDLSKGDSFERDKYSGLGIDEFHRVLRIFGYLCLKNKNKIEFNRDELHAMVQKAIDYCDDLDVQPTEFVKDILITVPLFSIDGIYYKWSHKSLQEYFAAQFIYLDSKERQQEMLLRLCFHPENASFLNVIDLYRSVDPVGFEHWVTSKLLNDYLEHLENTYSGFSGELKLERQQFSFGRDLILINIPFGDENEQEDEKAIQQFFKLVGEEINGQGKERRISIAINVVPKEENISSIKVPDIRTPYQTLIEFFFNHGEKFVKRKTGIEKPEKVDLKLPLKKVIPVTDRKNAFLNNRDNFRKTNELLRIFLERIKPEVIIDIEEAKAKIKEIKRSKANINNDDLYAF